MRLKMDTSLYRVHLTVAHWSRFSTLSPCLFLYLEISICRLPSLWARRIADLLQHTETTINQPYMRNYCSVPNIDRGFLMEAQKKKKISGVIFFSAYFFHYQPGASYTQRMHRDELQVHDAIVFGSQLDEGVQSVRSSGEGRDSCNGSLLFYFYISFFVQLAKLKCQ